MAAQISKRDQPGTQRDYETIFILRPDTQNDGIAAVNGKIKSIIEGLADKVLKLDNWGKRKLAYEVKGQLKGIYLYWRYLGNAGTVDELDFGVWRANFGQIPSGGSAAVDARFVPEPTAAMLLIVWGRDRVGLAAGCGG